MSQPELLQSELGDEPVTARVALGGDDALFVTPSRLVAYRAEGLLSDESVETYPHGAERITVSEGRRKATVTLDYGLDGDRSLKLPASAVDETLHHLLTGALDRADLLDDDERVSHTFRFSELTLAVTDRRLAKHVGAAVWDHEYEQFPFADVTDLAFEEGSVATSVVLTLDGRQERFKTPNDSARRVREAIESALLDYHDARDIDAFRARTAEADDDGTAASDDGAVDFGEGPAPLSTRPGELSDEPANATRGDVDAADEGDGPTVATTAEEGTPDAGAAAAAEEGDDGFDDTGFRAAEEGRPPGTEADADADADAEAEADAMTEAGAGADHEARALREEVAALREEVAALREAVATQGDRLDRQSDLVERLIEELRRGR